MKLRSRFSKGVVNSIETDEIVHGVCLEGVGSAQDGPCGIPVLEGGQGRRP